MHSITSRWPGAESISRPDSSLKVRPLIILSALDARSVRRQALELAMRLPKICLDTDGDRAAWIECARTLVQELGIILPEGQTIRTSLQSPRSGEWSHHLEQTHASTGLLYSTIHNAKGGEYAGVCVVIPPNDTRAFTTQLVDAWTARGDHEPKRVIYVGVTRAMRLAAFSDSSYFS
jgi:DNA helicase-2/ATP-dependent DNA helicase PcrA